MKIRYGSRACVVYVRAINLAHARRDVQTVVAGTACCTLVLKI